MMSQTPFEQSGSLRIGTVDFVSPDDIRVVLDIEAPESIALNTGGPRPFPRVNGYLLIPVDDGFVVGQVEWVTVEHSPFPKRRGMQDFGLVDLPYPLRKLRLNPLGMLRRQAVDAPDVFQRGADALPSVGAAVMLPTEVQLRSIIQTGEHQRVKIGSSPLAGDAEVWIDPDRLFGRHLAVLGNTGSGKSCSVAGLVRWSLEESKRKCSDHPNARFIILDPNGEYSRAFDDDGTLSARIFQVAPGSDEVEQLRVPLWFWNSAEWTSFAQASAKTQRPTLLQALRFARDGQTTPVHDASHGMRRFLRTVVSTISREQNSGSPWGPFPKPKSFHEKLEKWKTGLEHDLEEFEGAPRDKLQCLIDKIDQLCHPRQTTQYPHFDFTRPEVQDLLSAASQAHSAFGGAPSDVIPPDVDAPLPFDGASLLRNVEATAEMLNVSEHVETLLIRISALLTDTQMKPILGGTTDITLEQWLRDYIGNDAVRKAPCLSSICP